MVQTLRFFIGGPRRSGAAYWYYLAVAEMPLTATNIQFWGGVFLLLLIGIAYLIKPRHVGIRFSRTPPVIARVNAPSKGATDEQRVISLPTGDAYQIPACARGHFVMVFDWHVPIVVDGVAHELIIPKLSTTDFASIPRILHSLISPLTNTIYAAILHDYLYRNPTDEFARSLPRETVDRLFYWGMRARGVWRLTAGLMYLGVRSGGWISYKRVPGAK